MNPYLQLVEAAVQATEFVRETAYSWFGELSETLPAAKRRTITPATARGHLLSDLQSELYDSFYCKGFAAPSARDMDRGPAKRAVAFTDELSAANSGEGYWDAGWDVVSLANGEVIVSRAGLKLRAKVENCRVAGGALLEPGVESSLRLPKELRSISPGFYMAVSDCPLNQDEDQTLVRFYWNLTAEGAAPFVRVATSALNRASLPFQLKVVNDPARFTRCDAGVIYILKDDYQRAREILEDVYGELAVHLKHATPALSKRLAPGLGVAEDAGRAAVSFGMHRSRLLAEGMLRAHETGSIEIQDRVQAVVERFSEEGLSMEQPFLNAGSIDMYEFRVPQLANAGSRPRVRDIEVVIRRRGGPPSSPRTGC